MGKRTWTKEEEQLLTLCYKEGKPIEEIAALLNKTKNSISAKAIILGLTSENIKKNNPKFKAIYQDYDWCYQKFIIENKSHKEMAAELGCSTRVIQKWCSEVHGLNKRTYKENKHLSEMQKELIMFSLLGDGHIDKRETKPVFIISHAENQKDYLYWKYSILKDICNNEPTYHPESYANFGADKEYLCKSHYRLCTRIINDLISIREMSKSDIISKLNDFGICIHLLDDGSRSRSNWSVCVADFTDKEKQLYINKCVDDLSLNCYKQKDDRYIEFDADSSRRIDDIMLTNIPNDLDIIKYKIIDKYICKPAKYFYVHTDSGDVGLNNYCRSNNLSYLKIKALLDSMKYTEITDKELHTLLMGA